MSKKNPGGKNPKAKNSLDGAPEQAVASSEQATPNAGEPAGATNTMTTENAEYQNTENADGTRVLTLKQKPGARKSDRLVIFDYTDRPGSVQFLRTAFGETVPETIQISGAFAGPRQKLTKEQRKERAKNMTPAEKLAAAEARVAKLREKLSKAAAAPAAGEQPSA